MEKKKYQKPKLKEKKITLNFFMSNIDFLDAFTIHGEVFAQSGCTTAGNCSAGCSACAGNSTSHCSGGSHSSTNT